MKTQLEQRLVELRAEYESGQKILKDIEAKLVELENRKKNLNETLLRISGAIELLEEVLEDQGKVSTPEVSDLEVQEAESEIKEVEVPVVIRLPLEHAVKKLEETGLRVGNVGEKSVFVGGVRFGDVVQQEPKGGTHVDKGSAIDLLIAKKGKLKPNLSQNSLLSSFSDH
ncbi:TPA: PASTA domain-containing protein [Methanosarcina acetivorans]|uniref:PASTA domain-containing protein n=2 Tax=Methanosarcina acetivorans TaxID=2214 RepID=Q8TPE2_METAC|nr:PASTA domain-containing protein [Methanosarcina acetivorans]AAM05374.1 predicted protein [Methanosarcina acetivorans C2A]HIH92965.1 PASTA domain-containing protein [Methanosarcina acetivorans]